MLPLCPLPIFLPCPEPGPRPMRLRSRCEPGAGTRLCNPIFSVVSGFFFVFVAITCLPHSWPPWEPSPLSAFSGRICRRHRHHVANLIDLTDQTRRDLLNHDVLMMLEPHRLQRGAM